MGVKRIIIAGAGVLLGAAALVQFRIEAQAAWKSPPLLDDALTFHRYADHVLAGEGIAWNAGGPATYGCTSLLHLFWTTLVRWTGRGPATPVQAAVGLSASNPGRPPWKTMVLASAIPAVLSIMVMALACAHVVGAGRAEARASGANLVSPARPVSARPRASAALHSSGWPQPGPLRGFLPAWGFVSLCLLLQSESVYGCLSLRYDPQFARHAFSGMDTTLAVLLNALLILFAADRALPRSVWRLVLTAVVGYLAFLARPDNLLGAALFPGLLLLTSPVALRQRIRALGIFGGALAALLAVDSYVKCRVFGSPLPLPFYAKAAGFYAGYVGAQKWNPALYTREFLVSVGLPLLLLVFASNRRSWRFTLAAGTPCLLLFGYLVTVTQIMGMEARFYYPTLPFVLAAAWQALNTRLGGGDRPGPPVPAVARRGSAAPALLVRGVLGVAIVLLVFPGGTAAARCYEQRSRLLNPDLLKPGLYGGVAALPQMGGGSEIDAAAELVEHSPRAARWAMSEHGLIGALNPDVYILDLVGLHDRGTLARTPVLDRVLADRPDAIWFPHTDYTGMVGALASSREFNRQYAVWPGAFDYGFAIRRDSPWRGDIERQFRAVWRETYGSEPPPPAVWLGAAR